MVDRLTTREDALRLRGWFLSYMKGEIKGTRLEAGARAPRAGFLVGPSQLCKEARVNVSIGTRLFGDGVSARPYVPFPEYLRKLALGLRTLLRRRGHPQADAVTVIRAFLEAGYLNLNDVLEFLEAEGVEGWMKEADCIGGLDLRGLADEGRLVVEEMYRFQLLKETTE